MRSSHHPDTLFSLVPLKHSYWAQSTVSHPANSCYVSTLADGRKGLDIGFQVRRGASTTLASLGRGSQADIILEGDASISEIQCSFELNLEGGVVMLHDRSTGSTTQVYGNNSNPFIPDRPRKVLIQKACNDFIGIGGEHCNLLEFRLVWHKDPAQTAGLLSKIPKMARVGKPFPSQELDNLQTDIPICMRASPVSGRRHTMRFIKLGRLDSGRHGKVYRARDVDTGDLMAIKVLIPPPTSGRYKDWRHAVNGEIQALARLRHPHIVEYISSEWDESESPLENMSSIYTQLMEGTLHQLILGGAKSKLIAIDLLPQMLQALNYITLQGIVHRDVRPKNILYRLQSRDNTDNAYKYEFRLADFGSCNLAIETRRALGADYPGIVQFMAPEAALGVAHHTSKMDVWSLLATMLWALDRKFRRRNWKSSVQVTRAVISAVATHSELLVLQGMVRKDPELRSSAADMLENLYPHLITGNEPGPGKTHYSPLNQDKARGLHRVLDWAAGSH